ncbi:MAG TPA: EF-hand domain-containing protein, partial [Candidatus Binatia bacterium]|nr:EF-hand domain-containing protein [Candidatus Binatia bacterium]
MTLRLTLVALALACAAAPAAMADGGGGGGMSSSAPNNSPAAREDPTAAYQAGVAALNAQNYQEAVRQFRNARR